MDKSKEALASGQRKPVGDTDTSRTVGSGASASVETTSRRGSLSSPRGIDGLGLLAETHQPTLRPDPSTSQNEGPSTPQAPNKLPLLDTSKRPQTPPNTVATPSTFVTPPTPTLATNPSPPKLSRPLTVSSPPSLSVSPASGTTSKGTPRSRLKSANLGASKLSNATSSAPLTPPIEETKTPGGSLISPSGSGSFFSSVFSAAQNAANQFSNSINTTITPNQKNRRQSLDQGTTGGQEVLPGPESHPQDGAPPNISRPPAVETLGQGELSLDHLGISESSDPSPMTSAVDLSEGTLQPSAASQNEENAQKAEESAAARAISAAYDKPVQAVTSQATGGRPLSIASASSLGVDHSPSRNTTAIPDGSDIKRSGSVRSRLSGRAKRRHRGSSATTGGTLAAAISASTATLTHPGSAASGTGHRQTGFAVASSKRNKDFHQLFRSVPEDDYLIEDYSAALQRDILLHGRLYVSEGHICFSSNILGWVTNLVISFDEVVAV